MALDLQVATRWLRVPLTAAALSSNSFRQVVYSSIFGIVIIVRITSSQRQQRERVGYLRPPAYPLTSAGRNCLVVALAYMTVV